MLLHVCMCVTEVKCQDKTGIFLRNLGEKTVILIELSVCVNEHFSY